MVSSSLRKALIAHGFPMSRQRDVTMGEVNVGSLGCIQGGSSGHGSVSPSRKSRASVRPKLDYALERESGSSVETVVHCLCLREMSFTHVAQQTARGGPSPLC